MSPAEDHEHARTYDAKRPQYVLAELLLKHLPDVRQKKILDVGCGVGEFISVLKTNYGIYAVGVDGSDHCCAESLKKGLQCYNVNLEEERLPFKDESFDIVVSLEVIEHLWNTKHYLAEIQRVLKKMEASL